MSAMFGQEETRPSIAPPCAHATTENMSDNDKLGRKSVPKLNFFSRSSGGLFKKSKDKDSVDEQPAVGGDSNQQVRLQQRSLESLSDLVSPQLEEKLEQRIPSEEHQPPVWVDEGHVDVPRSNQQHCQPTEVG